MLRFIKALISKLSMKRNPVKQDPVELDFTGKFRVGRGMGGFAFHVIEGNAWEGLCGTAVVERKSEITPDELREHMPRQHEGFYYCSKCTTAFTGLEVEEQRTLRNGVK